MSSWSALAASPHRMDKTAVLTCELQYTVLETVLEKKDLALIVVMIHQLDQDDRMLKNCKILRFEEKNLMLILFTLNS